MAESAAKAANVELPVRRGDVIGGKYRLEEVLGVGGTAVVMSATHLQLQQKFAVKLLLPSALKQGVDHLERLLREARVIAQMKSPHVARVVDVGTLDDGAPFMVMELLEGVDLEMHLQRRGKLSIGEAVDYVMQVCEAVAEAHSLGVIHRDIKPGNIFITQDVDRRPLVKVLDFGLSKLGLRAAEQAHRKITQPLEVMGTPAYMSPEQLRATSDVDERSDIWSLGVVLYELLNGELPFQDPSVQELCAKVMRDAPKPHSVELPPGLETILQRCLQKKADHRFPKVSALAIALAPFAEHKGRLERVLRVQPLSNAPEATDTGFVRPETVQPFRPAGTQVPVVTDANIRLDDDDDENPFAKKRGGWSLFAFGVAGAISGAAILGGVAIYAGNNVAAGSDAPPAPVSASAEPPPPTTERQAPAPSASSTSSTSSTSKSDLATKPVTSASAAGTLGTTGTRRPLKGSRPKTGDGASISPPATTAAKAPPDPDKLLETR